MASNPRDIQISQNLREPGPPTMSRFHLFPELPPELRHMIWLFSMEPRDVIIPRRDDMPRPSPPAILHACRESRSTLSQRHYTRAFSSANPHPIQWVWVNFAIDTVHVHPSWLRLRGQNDFELPLIQKLVLDGKSGALGFNERDRNVLTHRMPALRELTVRGREDEDDGCWWLGWAVVFETLYHPQEAAPVSFHMRVLAPARPPDVQTPTELNTDNYRKKYRNLFWRFLRNFDLVN